MPLCDSTGGTVLISVTSPKDIDELFVCGTRYSSPHFSLIVAPNRTNGSRVLVAAGKRLGKAVVRNRAKRVIRESIRSSGGPWPGFQVAVIAKKPLIGLGAPEATDELAKLLRAAYLLR